jgi:hypothetical protein
MCIHSVEVDCPVLLHLRQEDVEVSLILRPWPSELGFVPFWHRPPPGSQALFEQLSEVLELVLVIPELDRSFGLEGIPGIRQLLDAAGELLVVCSEDLCVFLEALEDADDEDVVHMNEQLFGQQQQGRLRVLELAGSGTFWRGLVVNQVPSDLITSFHGVEQLPKELEAAKVLFICELASQVGLCKRPDLPEGAPDFDGDFQQGVDPLEESQSSGSGHSFKATSWVDLKHGRLPVLEALFWSSFSPPKAGNLSWGNIIIIAAKESRGSDVGVVLMIQRFAILVGDLSPWKLREQWFIIFGVVLLLLDPDELLKRKGVDPQTELSEFGAAEDGDKEVSAIVDLLLVVLVGSTSGRDHLVVADIHQDHALAKTQGDVTQPFDLSLIKLMAVSSEDEVMLFSLKFVRDPFLDILDVLLMELEFFLRQIELGENDWHSKLQILVDEGLEQVLTVCGEILAQLE